MYGEPHRTEVVMKRAAALCTVGLIVSLLAGPIADASPQPLDTESRGTIAVTRYEYPGSSESGSPLGSIITLRPDGSDERQITPSNLEVEDVPAWSPDGSKIAYTAYPSGDLFVVARDGTGLKQLTRGDGTEDWWPSWSPNGERIVVHRWFEDTGEFQLYLIDARDGRATRLTRGPYDLVPVWSPDGKWIAFVRIELSGDPHAGHHIWAIRPDGTGLRRVTAGLVKTWRPVWSPDSRRIAFSGVRNEQRESSDVYALKVHIYVVDSDGGRPARVTRGEVYDTFPCWAPDGDRIAFSRIPANVWTRPPRPVRDYVRPAYAAPADLFSVGTGGSNLRRITNTPSMSEEACAWTGY